MKNLGFKNKETLENLYWEQKLSLDKIAKGFGVSSRTIRYWMLKNQLQTRPKKGLKRYKYSISKNKLYELYVKKKMTLGQIAKEFGIKNHSTVADFMMLHGIKIRTISEVKTKHPRKPFSRNIIEKCYMLGLRTGDLAVYKDFHRIIVSTSSTHIAQINAMKKTFEKYSHVCIYIHKDKRGIKEWHVQCGLDSSFDFLVKKLEEIPVWILENDDCFFSFLAGYADAEGSFDVFRNTDNTINFHFRVASNDKIILNQILYKLKSKGFSCGLYLHAKKGKKATYGIYKKDVHALRMFRKNDVLRLVEILKKFSRHDEKLKRMNLILNLKKETKWNNVENKVINLRKNILSSRLQQTI